MVYKFLRLSYKLKWISVTIMEARSSNQCFAGRLLTPAMAGLSRAQQPTVPDGDRWIFKVCYVATLSMFVASLSICGNGIS